MVLPSSRISVHALVFSTPTRSRTRLHVTNSVPMCGPCSRCRGDVGCNIEPAAAPTESLRWWLYAEELQAVMRAKLRHMFESTSTAGAGGVRLHRC